MKTKLNELLEFPTPFTYKVMGQALPELVDQVVEVVQRHAPGDYTPTVKPSSKGNYHSVSITIVRACGPAKKRHSRCTNKCWNA
ncbi:DUF493 family protein YbeD, partial [Escherichia sp. TWPC-MK]